MTPMWMELGRCVKKVPVLSCVLHIKWAWSGQAREWSKYRSWRRGDRNCHSTECAVVERSELLSAMDPRQSEACETWTACKRCLGCRLRTSGLEVIGEVGDIGFPVAQASDRAEENCDSLQVRRPVVFLSSSYRPCS